MTWIISELLIELTLYHFLALLHIQADGTPYIETAMTRSHVLPFWMPLGKH